MGCWSRIPQSKLDLTLPYDSGKDICNPNDGRLGTMSLLILWPTLNNYKIVPLGVHIDSRTTLMKEKWQKMFPKLDCTYDTHDSDIFHAELITFSGQRISI